MSENLIKQFRINDTTYKMDYESLANRPFGVETRETVVPLRTDNYSEEIQNYSEQTAAYGFDCDPIPSIPDASVLKAGDLYVVTADGTEYECEMAFVENGSGYFHIGATELTDTGDFDWDVPFFIAFLATAVDGSGPRELDVFFQTSGSHSIKVERKVVSRIPTSLLPDYLRFGEMKREIWQEERTDTEYLDNSEYRYLDLPSNEYEHCPLIIGDTYIVTWDGTEHLYIAQGNDNHGTWLGNIFLAGYDYPDDGDTFLFHVEVEYGSFQRHVYTTETETTHTIKIEHVVSKQMDGKYLPKVYNGETEMSILEALNAISTATNAGITFTDEPVSTNP